MRDTTRREGGRVRMATTLPNRHRWTEPTATRGWNYTTSVLTKEMHACRGGCEREGSTRALALCPILGSQFLSVEHTIVLFDGAHPLPSDMVARVCFRIDAMKLANVLPSSSLDDRKAQRLGTRVDLRCPRRVASAPCSSTPFLHASLFRSTISIRRFPRLPPRVDVPPFGWPNPSSHTIRSFPFPPLLQGR